jgi:3'-phosphoadenosine 5'-phosphosulfate sulfotransferase (PAPS reductase)/FAD synthetase
MRQRVPEMEYFFCDTGAELPETYEYLNRLEVALGKPIERLNPDKGFDHWFEVYRGTLPSPQMRWCTRQMKIKPLEEWLGDVEATSYVAIRADEKNRKGYVSTKPNIKAVFPFVDDGIDHEGVLRILEDAGLGLPSYYEWRTRSGCYFCFYQRKAEWVGLAERHPELFERAVAIEGKVLLEAGTRGSASYSDVAMKGRIYTWSQGESLGELIGRKVEIKARHAEAMERASSKRQKIPLVEVLAQALDEDDDAPPCTVCAL